MWRLAEDGGEQIALQIDGDVVSREVAAAAVMSGQPIEIELVRECRFKVKPCGLCGLPKSNKAHTPKITSTCDYKRANGCANCGAAKNDPRHLGAPESFNLFGGRSGWQQYESIKGRWSKALIPLLAASDLPKPCTRISVEGEVSFGDNTARDQGNHRVIVEKALGDVLVAEGYLEGDKWHQYEFGGLQRHDEPGVNRIRLMLFPTVDSSAILTASNEED